jgi:hypothetical protein
MHPRFGLVVGHHDVEVRAVALRPQGVHLLKPDGWKLSGRVDDGAVRVIAASLVRVA